MENKIKICVIGLGYVGLPLAVSFSEKYEVVGFDINENRINELKKGVDKTLELNQTQVKKSLENGMIYTCDLDEIKECNIFIITVPTPINSNKTPDLAPLLGASSSVAKVLKKDDIVIYESTVYPGCTEEDCVPVLEKISGLKFNKDFFCGYSPERINPGDKEHTVSKIKKVTSGSTPKTAKKVDDLYKSIITAGTHLAPNIKTAEASKVIENSQRDINIAFVNELAQIFEKMNIDVRDVLEASGTKWNFLKFSPGLVGGHCIGVDPYYLTHKAAQLSYHPEIILAGRRINDNMGIYIANQIVKMMIKNGKKIINSKVLILGITFKENCTDIRNSRVIDIINELKDFGCDVDVSDTWADKNDVLKEYKVELKNDYHLKDYDVIVVAVGHNEYKNLKLNPTKEQLIYDVKGICENYTKRL